MSGEGIAWIATTETVDRILRQVQLSTADQITMDRKQLEGLLFEVQQGRKTKCRHGTPLNRQCVDCALETKS